MPRARTHAGAFIDLGTNSVRLTVVEFHDHVSTRVLTSRKETVRLGEGEFGERAELQPAAMDRAVQVCARLAELARAHGASDVVTVATAAVREAENRDAFVRRLRDEAGLHVRVVSGPEEARLVFLGVLSRVHVGAERLLTVDIGGGSTELAVGTAAGAERAESLRLGAIRLTALAPSGDGPVPPATYKNMRRRVELAIAPIVRRLRGTPADAAYGTSGTIVNLAAVAARSLHGADAAADQALARKDLRAVMKALRALPLDERRLVPALNPARADIIIAGGAIIETVMDQFGLESITALSECGLREGLVLDHVARSGGGGAGSVRERSVLRLAHATGGDDDHARHVAHLAVELFDSARAERLHDLGDRERELLRYAALLHDIGSLLSYTDHQRHTFYLIRNADLLGFDQEETAVMAATAFYHRKGLPKARHDEFRSVEPGQRDRVRTMSLLLRLAEVLDRGHGGVVRHATLRRSGPRDVTLALHTSGDWRLEEWGLERRRETLEKALRARLTVVARTADAGGPA